ncbi:hypothetical protein HDU97_000575 [Phlyctochytrium planicorne]|nr:hypothetical protein HDU97_000575 [Phlyctochytrium planicorne]
MSMSSAPSQGSAQSNRPLMSGNNLNESPLRDEVPYDDEDDLFDVGERPGEAPMFNNRTTFKKRSTPPPPKRTTQFFNTIASRFFPATTASNSNPSDGLRGEANGDERIPGLYYGPSRPLRPGPPTHLKRGASFPDWAGFSGRRVAYDNFTTIDWIHDLTMERMRLVSLGSIEGWEGRVRRMFDASQAWIVVFFVGILTGWIAGYIDVGSGWLADIKEGYCSAGFYLNRKFCCWHRQGS